MISIASETKLFSISECSWSQSSMCVISLYITVQSDIQVCLIMGWGVAKDCSACVANECSARVQST